MVLENAMNIYYTILDNAFIHCKCEYIEQSVKDYIKLIENASFQEV